MRRRRWPLITAVAAAAFAAAVAAASDPGHLVAGAAPASGFTESFDGQPTTPEPFRSPNWDVTVHSRDVDTWLELEPVHADHGHDCGPPPATHATSAYEEAVFSCRDHVMTALNATGYGLVYLTPDQMVDFSDGEAVVRFDVSTLRSSGRDWIDLWVTPYDDNLQLALIDWLPDLTGPPRNAVHVTLEHDNTWKVFVYDDFVPHELELGSWEGYDTFLTPDAKRRDTFELRLSRDHVTFGMPDHDHWWVDTSVPTLDWSQGIVQLGHHSYNPTKDCALEVCGPTTWHWDDVQIEPAVPFTIIGADRRYVDEATTDAIRFDRPAPPGAHLRFAGIGADLAVSYDGGRSWQPALMQSQYRDPVDESFRSHWMPLPPGVQEVRFRGAAWWGGSWMVRDASIWAEAPGERTSRATPPPATPATTTTAAARPSEPAAPACRQPGHWRAGGWADFARRICAGR